MIALWLTLAGGLGATVRFVLDGHIRANARRNFPLGTILINASGSLVLGIVTGLVLRHQTDSSVKLIIGTGFCGGFTTFSTASFEFVRLIEENRYAEAAIHSLGNIALSLSLAALGLWAVGI